MRREANNPGRLGKRQTLYQVLLTCLAFLFVSKPVVGVAEPMPYLKNFEAALAKAQASGRTVILYTGRIGLCLGNDPQKHFFDVLFKEHPELAAQSNRFVICERFIHIPAEDARGSVSGDFIRAAATVRPLTERYRIRGFHPTVTFLDATGAKLNVPFAQLLACDAAFTSSGDDCYATLREYAAAAVPLRVSEAQRRLRAAVLNSTNLILELYRAGVDRSGSQREILVGTGLTSRSDVVGEAFHLAVRECGVVRGDFSSGGYDESLVAVVGKLEGAEHFTGPIFVRRNEAYFRTELFAVGTSPDHFRKFSSVTLLPGEYYFGIHVRDERIGQELLRAFKTLQPSQ